MNISGINFESIVDGEGVRVVIYVSGCKHNCQGCHNPDTHDFLAGRNFTEEIQNAIIQYINDTPFISGITLSGGDPLYSAGELIPFVNKLRSTAKKRISIWIYSGFTYDEIIGDSNMYELIKMCDVLIDGKFELAKRNVILAYRGSSNQRIIDIQKSLKERKIVLMEENNE